MEYTEERYKLLLQHINKYRMLIKTDDFEKIFEPLQFLITDPDDAIVKVKDNDDLKSWQKEISYSFLVKINTIENAILKFIDQNDVYTASILVRHHMEQCGYISLAMEKLLEFIKTGSYDPFEKYLAKTLFGSPLSNNKKFKYSMENFSLTRTPNIVSFINSLDRFMEKMVRGSNNKNIFAKNYSALNHFAHPSSLSSTFFIDAKEVENGHEIKFRYDQNFCGLIGKINTLRILEQNIVVGYSSYYIFNSIEIHDNEITQNINTIKFAYENIIEKFKESISDGDFA